MTIVRTYSGAAKSGPTLSQRPGLKQLIDDAEQGAPGFRAGLIYDVSQSARFVSATGKASSAVFSSGAEGPIMRE